MGVGSWDKLAPDEPYSPKWYLTERGGEYVHLYLWILKDLSWTQDWYYVGNAAGSVAVLWGCFMLHRAYTLHNRNELITGSSQLLWLIANLWWMSGELHDWEYRKDANAPLLYPSHTVQCGYILQTSLLVMVLYYLFLRPFHISVPAEEALEVYNETGLEPRCPSFFATWREYENNHILWWLCTDYAWNTLNPTIWVLTGIPTIIIAADFVACSFRNHRLIVDHFHYIAQFLWFLGNFVWAFGELFDPAHDYPYALFATDPEARRTFRWWSSWCLIAAYVPIVVLHVIWIAKTRRMQKEAELPRYRYYAYTPILPTVVPGSSASTSPSLRAEAKSVELEPIIRSVSVPMPVMNRSPSSSTSSPPSLSPHTVVLQNYGAVSESSSS